MRVRDERGNVTLIAAFTMMLMVMLVVLATGVADNGARATNVQATSDDAAITAAESYIAVVNDVTLIDTIDWGFGFLDHLAEDVAALGDLIAAVPFLEAVGAAISTVANIFEEIINDVKDIIDNVLSAVKDVLDVAKSVLTYVNATIAAADNGYLGFLLPISGQIVEAGGRAYTLKDVVDFVNAEDVLNTSTDLQKAVQNSSLETIWANGQQDSIQSRLGNPKDPRRDTFKLWPSTPGCVDPPTYSGPLPVNSKGNPQTQPAVTGNQWTRPCDEFAWALRLDQGFYWKEEAKLITLKNVIADPKTQFQASAGALLGAQLPSWSLSLLPGGISQLLADPRASAVQLIQGEIDHLDADAKAQTTWRDSLHYYDSTDASKAPWNRCPGGPQASTLGGFTFKCQGAATFGGTFADFCGSHLCQQYWAPKDQLDFIPACTNGTPGPNNNPPCNATTLDQQHQLRTDYRNTQDWQNFINRDALNNFTSTTAPPTGHTAEAASSGKDCGVGGGGGSSSGGSGGGGSSDSGSSGSDSGTNAEAVCEPFVMVAQIQPNYMQQLAYKVAGKSSPPTRYSVAVSLAKIVKASKDNDRVLMQALCAGLFHDGHGTKVLGFIPTTALDACDMILGSFQALADLRLTIQGWADGIESPLRFKIDLGFVTICPFCWLAELIQDAVNALLGPTPPDQHTYHVRLVSAFAPNFCYIAGVAAIVENPSVSNINTELGNVINGQPCAGGTTP